MFSFDVPSMTNMGETYTITIDTATGTARCSCPAFIYSKAAHSKTCKHINGVAAVLFNTVLAAQNDDAPYAHKGVPALKV